MDNIRKKRMGKQRTSLFQRLWKGDGVPLEGGFIGKNIYDKYFHLSHSNIYLLNEQNEV